MGFVGAGNYARSVLLPAVDRCGKVRPLHVIAATGASARHTAEKFGYGSCGTDPEVAFGDPDVDLVFIATRHDSHASLAARALRAGKAVWLEKPAALDDAQLQELAAAVEETNGFLTLGFNRRFSQHTQAVAQAFSDRKGPMAIHYTVAAGATPSGTWLTDPRVGGGRIVGEVCHFVDLCTHLVGAPPRSVCARSLTRDPETDDSTIALLGFPDGSTATIAYLANTSRTLPKERWEVSADGKTAICDNFRLTQLPSGKKLRSVNQDKGQTRAVATAVDCVRRGAAPPLSLLEIIAVSRTTFRALESAATDRVLQIGSLELRR